MIQKQIPTLIGLLILLAGFTGGLLLVENRTSLLPSASPENAPNRIKTTNLSDTSLTISWSTNNPTSGFISYGETSSLGLTARDDRDQTSGQTGKFFNHYVTLRNLKPNTQYYYVINSEETVYRDGELPFEIKTAVTINEAIPESDVISGIILDEEGNPASGSIVYLNINNITPQSALVRSSGDWFIPLNSALSLDLNNYARYHKEIAVLELFIQGNGPSTAQAYTTSSKDNPVPEIILGQTYDFRQSEQNADSGTLTPTPTLISKFNLSDIEPVKANEEDLSILNPNQNENLNTQQPEFFGTGSPGKKVTILIQSPIVYQGQTIVDESGGWRWTPPKDLTPGEHTIKVTIGEVTITKNFTVLAAENDLPAYTATPSGYLTPTAKLTTTPTPSKILTLTATPSPITNLQPGNKENTIALLLVGLLLIFIPFIWYSKYNQNYYG